MKQKCKKNTHNRVKTLLKGLKDRFTSIRTTELQNILSWKGPMRIIEPNS